MSFKTTRAGAGSGEVPGRSALFAAAGRVVRCGSFMACDPAGCRGEAWLKKGLAQRLLADGERVLDVPAKLAARARVSGTGRGHKTDATDASWSRCGTRHYGN